VSIGFQVNCFVLVFPVKSSSASDIPRRKTNLAVNWVREYILFHKKRHPREMGVPEINQFIIHLVVDRKASASTRTAPAAGAGGINPLALFSSCIATSTKWNWMKILLGSFAPKW
jgi:hypothetical protein